MTELLLIRHAVNDFVKTGKLAGWTPEVHLNEHGKAQAKALGQRLAQVKINAIYSSPLERTVETAQAILEHHPHLQLQLLDTIGEVRYGDWQGQEIRKLVQRKMWSTVQVHPSRVRFPNGEAMRDVQLRAVNALELLVERHPRQTVAVVSHSDVIKMIVTHYLGLHLDLFQRIEISPASLTIIAMSHSRPSIVQVNETSYLPEPKDSVSDEADLQAIVVGTVGKPGERIFYLQAQRADGSVSSILFEKAQSIMLADQIDEFFKNHPEWAVPQAAEPAPLQEPGETTFRAGKFGLQYNQERNQVCLEISELTGHGKKSRVICWWTSIPQMMALARTARQSFQGGLDTHGEN